MRLRQVFLVVLSVVFASALVAEQEDLNRGVPSELRWVMFVPDGRLNCVEKKLDPVALSHMVAMYAPGTAVAASEYFTNPDFLEQMPDGSYRVTYWTIVISRFDPLLQSVPEEPIGESECSRRWHASEVISILIKSDPSIGWLKNGYDKEVLKVLKQLSNSCEPNRNREKPKPPQQKQDPSTPVLPALPAKEVRTNAAPALAGRFF